MSSSGADIGTMCAQIREHEERIARMKASQQANQGKPSELATLEKELEDIRSRARKFTPIPHVVDKEKIETLLKEVDPQQEMDEDSRLAFLQIADNFIDNILIASCAIARHRTITQQQQASSGSSGDNKPTVSQLPATTLEAKDVALALDQQYNMWIPGFESADDPDATARLRDRRPHPPSDAHKQRQAIIKKIYKTH